MTTTVDGGDEVLLDRRDSVLTVTINRPDKKNALDDGAWNGLRAALRVARTDDSVRSVVLTGAGADFCAGADLGGDRGNAHPLGRMRGINEIAVALHELPKPVVAKVRGVAVGAGWNLALGCDLVVSAPNARFSQIFTKRGLSLDFGGSWLLPRIVGMQQAKRLALLGEFVQADEALQLGLVTWIKQEEELDAFTDEIADRLASGPPVALAQNKQLLHDGSRQNFRDALEGEGRAQTINFATEDAPEAIAAFVNKTEPQFTGDWAVR